MYLNDRTFIFRIPTYDTIKSEIEFGAISY